MPPGPEHPACDCRLSSKFEIVESGPQSAEHLGKSNKVARLPTIRDLSKVGSVLQVAADAQANTAYGIQFDLEDDAALVNEARRLAIADAQGAAQELAKLTGVELGEIVSITEEEPDDGLRRHLRLSAIDGSEALSMVLAAILGAGGSILQCETEHVPFDDVFCALVSGAAEHEQAPVAEVIR